MLRHMTALLLPLPPPPHLFCWRFTGLRTGRGARTRLPEGARIVGQKPSATRERQTALKAPEKPAIPNSGEAGKPLSASRLASAGAVRQPAALQSATSSARPPKCKTPPTSPSARPRSERCSASPMTALTRKGGLGRAAAPEKARPRRGPGRGCADHERGATRASEIHELKHSSVVASVRSEPWALSFRRLLESGCLGGDLAERYVVIRLAAMVHHRA